MRPVNYTVAEMDENDLVGHHVFLAHNNEQLIAHLKSEYGENFEINEESRSESGRYTDLVIVYDNYSEDVPSFWVQCTPEKDQDSENLKY